MSDSEWQAAWRDAIQALDDPILDLPPAEASRAFELTVRLARDSRQECDLHLLARDCAAMGAVLPQGGPGFVKNAYFSTRPDQIDRLLHSLVFLTLLARLSGYDGPLAWISFPVNLLDIDQDRDIARHLGRIVHVAEPDLAAPLEPVFEKRWGGEDPADAPPVYVGGRYPFPPIHGAGSPDSFEVQHGLPVVCIPSRATSGLTIRMGPVPEEAPLG